jgi:hypothetical protein
MQNEMKRDVTNGCMCYNTIRLIPIKGDTYEEIVDAVDRGWPDDKPLGFDW